MCSPRLLHRNSGEGAGQTRFCRDLSNTDATKAWSPVRGVHAPHGARSAAWDAAGEPAEIVGAVLYLVSDFAHSPPGPVSRGWRHTAVSGQVA